MEWVAIDSLARVFSKGNFTSFQSVYGCLSVYRYMYNVSPHFHNCCLSNFLAAFLQEHVSILRNTIVYGDIKICRSK